MGVLPVTCVVPRFGIKRIPEDLRFFFLMSLLNRQLKNIPNVLKLRQLKKKKDNAVSAHVPGLIFKPFCYRHFRNGVKTFFFSLAFQGKFKQHA